MWSERVVCPNATDKFIVNSVPFTTPTSSPIGRSYKNAYCVNSREQLDERLSKVQGCEWEWQPDGSIRVTTEAVPALRLVGNPNQNFVFQHTFSNSIVAAYLGWQDSRNDRHDALQFGNKEKMPEEVLDAIAAFMNRERVLHKWQKGDIMAVNNQRKNAQWVSWPWRACSNITLSKYFLTLFIVFVI